MAESWRRQNQGPESGSSSGLLILLPCGTNGNGDAAISCWGTSAWKHTAAIRNPFIPRGPSRTLPASVTLNKQLKRDGGAGNAWLETEPGTIKSREESNVLEQFRRRVMRTGLLSRGKHRDSSQRGPSRTLLAQRVLRDVGLATACLVIVIAFFYWRPFALPEPTAQPAVGHPASFLEVYPLEKIIAAQNLPLAQEPRALTMEDFAGKITLVFFWGPWTEPSVDALRRLAAVLPIFTRKDFQFVAVACPPPHEIDMPTDFLSWTETTWKECQIPVTCYLDFQGRSQRRFALLNQGSLEQPGRPAVVLPTAVLIDGDGMIRAVWEGWIHNREKEILKEVEHLLGPPVHAENATSPPEDVSETRHLDSSENNPPESATGSTHRDPSL